MKYSYTVYCYLRMDFSKVSFKRRIEIKCIFWSAGQVRYFTFGIRCYLCSNEIRPHISLQKERKESSDCSIFADRQEASLMLRSVCLRSDYSTIYIFNAFLYKTSVIQCLLFEFICKLSRGAKPMRPHLLTLECPLLCSAVTKERGCCKVTTRSLFLMLTLPWPLCRGPNHFTGRSKRFKSTIQDESAVTDLLEAQ